MSLRQHRVQFIASAVVSALSLVASIAAAQGAPAPEAPPAPPAEKAPEGAQPAPGAGEPKPADKSKPGAKGAEAPAQPPGAQQPSVAPAPPGAVPPESAPGAGEPGTAAQPVEQPGEAPPVEPPPTAPPPAAPPPGPALTSPEQRSSDPQVAPGVYGVDVGEKPPEEEPLPPPQMSLGVEASGGLNARLSSGVEGFDSEDRVDMALGLGGWFAPNRSWSAGLLYQRTGLGNAETAPLVDSLAVQYDLNTLWLAGRAYPMRNDDVGLFVQLALGASWQEVNATGTRATSEFTTPAEGFICSEAAGPGFSLGGGVGVDVDIDRHLAFVALVDGSGHQQSGDVVDGCAPGVGSITALGARIGFMYRFDLDEEPARSRAHTPRAPTLHF